MKLALLVVDMQKEYFKGANLDSMSSASEHINEVLGYFRQAGEKVVWIQDQDDEDGVVPGTTGFEIIDSLTPLDDELLIVKKYGNAFNKTKLDEVLKKAGVDSLIVSGYCAEYCVLSTYRGALDCDYTPFLLKNGVASGSLDKLKLVESISDTVTYNFLKKVLLG